MTKLEVEIDGSQGEGGGQVLRTALGLAAVTGKGLRVDRIRARREKPGLMRQHLACVLAAADVTGARVSGASIGSTSVSFEPGPVTHGDRTFSIGTAGATALVLQTVLPPLLLTPGRSRLVLEGGTHGRMAPPSDFIERAFLPLLRRMGASVDVVAARLGFFPAGGGRLVVDVEGGRPLSGLCLLSRGALQRMHARALVANLPLEIGRRELGALRARLPGLRDDDVEVVAVDAAGPGNALVLDLQFEQLTEVVSAFGDRKTRAEAVVDDLAAQAQALIDADVPVGLHLADQLVLPLALAACFGSGGGSFRTLPPTLHTRTNIAVIQRFLDVDIAVHDDDKATRIDVSKR